RSTIPACSATHLAPREDAEQGWGSANFLSYGGLGLGLRIGDLLGEGAGAGLDGGGGCSGFRCRRFLCGFRGGFGGSGFGGFGLSGSFAVGTDKEGSFLGYFL